MVSMGHEKRMHGDDMSADGGDQKVLWAKILRAAEAELSAETVRKWLAPVSIKMLRADSAVLVAPTAFVADWVERNYGLLLLRCFQAAGTQVRRVSVIVSRPDDATVVSEPVTESSDLPDNAGLRSAPLDPRFTFESFVVGKPNELAHAAARLNNPSGNIT